MSYHYYKNADKYQKEYDALTYGSQQFDNVWAQVDKNQRYSNVALAVAAIDAIWLLCSYFY